MNLQPDVEKSLLGEISALIQVEESIKRQIIRAEHKMIEAEGEKNDAIKVHGFLRMEIARKRAVLAEWRDQNK